MPATERQVTGTDSPNAGRSKWNLTQSELVALANALELSANEVWRGASAPATPHNYKTWIYIPPGYNGTSITAIWREWDGDSWQDMSVGPAGQGFTWRGAWATDTLYNAYDVVSHAGSTYLITAQHTSSAGSQPPNTNTALMAAAGAEGGTHAASHVDGADQIPTATTTERGLMGTGHVSKLNGIESGATADMTPTEIRTALLTVDGDGSGLDADLLDGQHKTDFQLKDQKGQANGYMGLNAAILADPAQLGSGTRNGAKFLRDDGTWQPLAGGLLYVNTSIPAGNNFVNTSTENTFASTYSVPSSIWAVGRPLRVTVRGTATNTTGSSRSYTYRIYLGGVKIYDSAAASMGANTGTHGFDIDIIIVPFSAGAAGTVEVQGSGGLGTGAILNSSPNTAQVTVDMTSALILSVTEQMSAAVAGASTQLRQLMVEAL